MNKQNLQNESMVDVFFWGGVNLFWVGESTILHLYFKNIFVQNKQFTAQFWGMNLWTMSRLGVCRSIQ